MSRQVSAGVTLVVVNERYLQLESNFRWVINREGEGAVVI